MAIVGRTATKKLRQMQLLLVVDAPGDSPTIEITRTAKMAEVESSRLLKKWVLKARLGAGRPQVRPPEPSEGASTLPDGKQRVCSGRVWSSTAPLGYHFALWCQAAARLVAGLAANRLSRTRL